MWSSKEAFIEYLRGTLIPDLKESGCGATAEDFEKAIEYMESKPLTSEEEYKFNIQVTVKRSIV